MSDYFATLRVQHGPLKAALEKSGMKSFAELARRSGVHYQNIIDMVNFRSSPRRKYGQFKKTSLRISNALGVLPEHLFPVHLDHPSKKNTVSTFVEHYQLAGQDVPMLGPAEAFDTSEALRLLQKEMDRLLPREKSVLEKRFFENKTHREIGSELGIGGQRVQQIEAKALRRLRHPSRVHNLVEAGGVFGIQSCVESS